MPAHVRVFRAQSVLSALLARLLWHYQMSDFEEKFCPFPVAVDEKFYPVPVPPRKALDALPPEIWGAIFDYNHDDVPTINAIRMVCRAWMLAAWKAFAKSFDYRMFHPTVQSLRALQALASRSDCAPYVTRLNMSTVRPHYDCAEVRRTLTDQEIDALPPPDDFHSTRPRTAFAYSIRHGLNDRLQPQRVMQLQLRQALRKLSCLEEIRVVDVSTSVDSRPPFTNVISREMWAAYPRDMTNKPYNLRAQATTLSLLFSAMRPLQGGRKDYLRNLTKLNVDGEIYLGSLPDNTSPYPRSPALSQIRTLTHLDLSITEIKPPLDPPALRRDLFNRLPNFLSHLPKLTHLALHFPPPTMQYVYNPAGAIIGTSITQLYGDSAFNILCASLHLKNLESLRFSHLGLPSLDPLAHLLRLHSPNLRHLSFLSLGLPVWDWRAFTHFLARELDLDTFEMDSDASAEQRAYSAEIWGLVAPEYRFTWKEFRRTARRARLGTLESGGAEKGAGRGTVGKGQEGS